MKLPRTIYALQHDATGKVYIGSTANPHQRFIKHCNRLKNGTHNSRQLQADYDQHEDKSLTFVELDKVRTFDERGKEYEWMAVYNSFDPDHGYNYADPKLPTSPSHKH